MSKIYVFGIGGTGSRVLRALTMLLATGVKCNADAIVPIIIDPDAAAGDVERTVTLMKQYGEIRKKLNFNTNTKNGFFRTDIQQIMPNFRLPLNNTKDCNFGDYMNVGGMTPENQALVNILFSQKNLASDMTVGFKGNPNVGSIVLNQFDTSLEFLNFANEFTAQDKIFIISSIFGGTGASGFPLLLKTLRVSREIANHALVNNAHIGAITVLPYFKVRQPEDRESQIDSATFVSKAKSALAYYERNISRNNTVDTLYYVADDTRTTYNNVEGGTNQRNKAHFVEVAAALALIDFANTQRSVPARTVHKEFGIETDTNEIIFENLGGATRTVLSKPMTQFILFSKYIGENRSSGFLSQPWARDRRFDSTFFRGNFIRTLKEIQTAYLLWLSEMNEQERKFAPFDLRKNPNQVFDLIKGITPKKQWWMLDKNFKLFDNRLNKQRGKTAGTNEQQLVELFYLATKQLVKEKFNIE